MSTELRYFTMELDGKKFVASSKGGGHIQFMVKHFRKKSRKVSRRFPHRKKDEISLSDGGRVVLYTSKVIGTWKCTGRYKDKALTKIDKAT